MVRYCYGDLYVPVSSGLSFVSNASLWTIMTITLPILDAMPESADFYSHYWGCAPFVVRGCVPDTAMEAWIAGDELAALACEDTVRSRLVHAPIGDKTWDCVFGPFEEEDFTNLGSEGWSLLVQNVEQFHPMTAGLLHHFNFSPRWLLDDIMVSYATPGGTVGPHMDSYHVFLVQGEGARRWTIGQVPLAADDEVYLDDLALKVLAHDFVGDEVTVSAGDVIYIPPRFAHAGVTLENSLTYSVGFLGPKQSDLFMAYGEYLSEIEALDQPYAAGNLDEKDAGFILDPATLEGFRGVMTAGLQGDQFSQWLSEFFAGSSNEHVAHMGERDDSLSSQELMEALSAGGQLIKPPYVKLVIARSTSGDFHVGYGGQSTRVDQSLADLVDCLGHEQAFTVDGDAVALELVTVLYNDQALELV
jgi:50S ribosomal protein L16 3-hydroxylase